jgi:D-serine deaminase-like pyridoxal phosphate-dependent protein
MSGVIVNIPVSVGEALDRLSILELKSVMLPRSARRQQAEHESGLVMAALRSAIDLATAIACAEYRELAAVNMTLWRTEDAVRAALAACDDAKWASNAKCIAPLNDRRAKIKARLNELFGSALAELKSHETCQ